MNAAGVVRDVDISVSIENEVIPSEFYNQSPTCAALLPDHSITTEDDDRRATSSSIPPLGCDQCTFFHYVALTDVIAIFDVSCDDS